MMTCSVRTLLLIEDFAPDRELYRRALLSDATATYRFIEADSVRSGLELCQTEAIDAILLDYLMPDADGLQFLELLQAQSNGSSPPVVMVTGEGDEAIAVSAMKLGVEDYLVKRLITPETLQMAIRSAIENAQLRRQLREANQQITTIWESMTDAYVTLDRQWQIVYANPAATQVICSLTQLEPGEFLGKTHWEVFPWSVGQITEREYRRALAEQVAVHFELFYEPSGDWFEVHAYPSPVGLGIYFRDISDRKRAEETVRQQLSEIEAIYETAPIGLCFVDTDLRFVRINEQLAESNGFLVSEHLGRTLRDILPEMADQLEPLYRQVIESGEPILNLEVQGTNCAQPGALRHWLVSYHPQKDTHQNVVGVNVTVKEITEQKRAELERSRLLAEAEAARAEAEAANRGKDEFVAIVAHELRSPLNSIAGWSKLLQTRQFDDATLKKALDAIYRNTQAQVQLVEDLLDITRLVRGTLQIHPTPLKLGEVIQSALELVCPTAAAKQIQIETQLRETAPISGDVNRLQQVVVNLLTNAVKFTPGAGRVEVSLVQVQDYVELQVRDTGKGIAAEFLPLIFERFQQGQRNTGAKDGLGLGLAIVKSLVELHQGTIAVESSGVGQGATFTVKFPVLKPLGQGM
jgi:PAS domain S-box-containing protein